MLVQLGQEPVIFAPQKDKQESAEDTVMVSVTSWRDECDEEHWNDIVKNPFRALQNMVESHGADVKLLASWGISCHHHSKTLT